MSALELERAAQRHQLRRALQLGERVRVEAEALRGRLRVGGSALDNDAILRVLAGCDAQLDHLRRALEAL